MQHAFASGTELLRRLPGSSRQRRLFEWSARLCATALAVLIAYTAAGLTWQLVPITPEPAVNPTSMPSAANDEQDTALDYEQIAAWHLFGKPPSDDTSSKRTPSAPVDAPETQLDLTLKGVYFSPDSPRARAIIAGPDGNDEQYAVGAELPGGATLEDIRADRVILSRSGRFETLRLPHAQLPVNKTHKRQPSSAGPDQARASRLLGQYQQRLRDEPLSLIDRFTIQPARRGGRLVGYRLRSRTHQQDLKTLGLQPGDVITSINGVTLDSPTETAKLLRRMTSAKRLRLTVLRDEQQLTREFSITR